MPRSSQEQERTYQRFIDEVRKASNAIEILALYGQMMDDGLENEMESFNSERQLVAKKDDTIAQLRRQIHELCGHQTRGPHSRWN